MKNLGLSLRTKCGLKWAVEKPVGSLSYMYDAAGRRTQVGGSLAATGFPNAVSSAAYDVANELTSWNGTTIGYDANGNISNDGVASYTWNGRNQSWRLC